MFAKNVRNLRKGKDLTQLDLAKLLGVSAGTVGMWEIGKREPSYSTLIKLAKVLNVSIDYLLTGAEFKEQKKQITITLNCVGNIEIKDIRSN